MRTRQTHILFPLLLTVVIATFGIRPAPADPIDYTSPEREAVIKSKPWENRVIRMALGLGRSSGVLTKEESKTIFETFALNAHSSQFSTLPPELNEKWQRLLRIAQIQAQLEAQNTFFPVGYEFEVGHQSKNGWEDFKNGFGEFKTLIAQTFGVHNGKVWQVDDEDGYHDDWAGEITDDAKRKWPVVTEWVRPVPDPDDYYDSIGWELVTPPFRKAEDLQSLAALRISLGQSKFGLATAQTGLHQTNTLVPSVQLAQDANYLGRVAANRLLLQAQFAPALFDVLDIKRGGAHTNLFLRPIVLDHQKMLDEIRTTDPSKIDIKFLDHLMNDKYIDQEFAVQVKEDEALAFMPPEKREKVLAKMLQWSKKKKAEYTTTWKYRDGQLKILPNIPEKALWELRIGDYVHDRPEVTMLQTLLEQKLTAKANQLAAEGKIFQLQIPDRESWMSDNEYWDALKSNRHASVDAMLETIGLDDPNLANLIKGKSFVVTEPKIEPSKARSYAFEGESTGESLVHYIVPRDPGLREKWHSLEPWRRVSIMKKMGFEFGKFDPAFENYRVLTTEFTTDLAKFPYLSPDLHVEASGNWEIKSSPHAIPNIKTLKSNMTEVHDALDDDDWVGFHMHEFVPKTDLQPLNEDLATSFAKNMERRSLYMTLTGYSEADHREKELDYLDSWSLDRFSPNDIEQIKGHLNGTVKLDSLAQKYHSIAFRPMGDVIDLEARDLDEDIDYGARHLEGLNSSIEHQYFGDPSWNNDPPIFNEFKDHSDLSDVKQFTLEGALSTKYKLTPTEKSLLHKMQFEIARPIMGEYVYFEDFSGLGETPDHLLDTKYIRPNFENNISLPLLNYDQQSFLTAADKAAIAKEREKYIERIYQLLKRVSSDPKYAFLKKHDDFLYLADYLKRSTHPTRPNLEQVSEHEAKEQRAALRKLVDDLRSETIKSIQRSDLASRVEKSLPTPAESAAKGTPPSERVTMSFRELDGSPETQGLNPSKRRPLTINETDLEHPAATVTRAEAPRVLRAYIPEEAELIALLCKKAHETGEKPRVRVRANSANSGRRPSSIDSFELGE